MSPLEDSKAIFLQLADTHGSQGVHTIIENHDAWSHNAATISQLNATLRAQLTHAHRPASVTQRITLQHQRLHTLAVPLPKRLPVAG